jgi:dephospho-CoA kinase
VIDADESARLVVAPGEPGLEAVVERFGGGILTANGELDRRALRAVVFADPDERRDLEAILHPLIRADMERRALTAAGPYLVLAIPLLVESARRDQPGRDQPRRDQPGRNHRARDARPGRNGGARDRVDRILVVDTDEAKQLQRLMARDSISLDEARAILTAQADRATRLAAADDVLVNSGTVAELRHAVDLLHERYLQLAALAPE